MTTKTLPPITVHGKEYPDLGYCYGAGFRGDGPVIHTTYCTMGDGWGDTAVSSSRCIQNGQDGARIQAEREAAAERRRFTPPEFRDPVSNKPGPLLKFNDRRQRTEIVALRGRPRGGAGEWTTWETYDEAMPNDFRGSMKHLVSAPVPRPLTAEQAQKIVEEFTSRLPHYEFQIVRARFVIEEEQIA